MSIVKTYKITSIENGIVATFYEQTQGTYSTAIGIDPDNSVDGGVSNPKKSGYITPVPYEKFSSSFSGKPQAIITNPIDEKVYVVNSGGTIYSYSNTLGSETTVGTVTGSTNGGAIYYNNYIYVLGSGASANDVSRYGPLSSSPSLTNGVWTGATLGSQTALGSTVTIVPRQMSLPGHWACVHGDGAMYFLDFGTANTPATKGRGMVHKIKTTYGGAEGDTNDGSAYNVLDLPPGYFPTCITSYGTDLVISAIQGQSTVLNQGKSALFFWDTFSDTFYNKVDISDPLITSVFNNNNTLYIFAGNSVSGFRVLRYEGGKSVRGLFLFEDGMCPYPGAVDSFGDRLSFGSYTVYPEASASVWSIGSKDGRLPKVLHNTMRSSSVGANPMVTAIKYVNQASNISPRVIIGWSDNSSDGLDKLGGSMNSLWRSLLIDVGHKFVVRKLTIPLSDVTNSAFSIVPAIYTDDLKGTIYTLPTINDTTFAGKRQIVYKNPKMNGTVEVTGNHNLLLELRYSGSSVVAVAPPIEIEVEIFTDEPTVA